MFLLMPFPLSSPSIWGCFLSSLRLGVASQYTSPSPIITPVDEAMCRCFPQSPAPNPQSRPNPSCRRHLLPASRWPRLLPMCQGEKYIALALLVSFNTPCSSQLRVLWLRKDFQHPHSKPFGRWSLVEPTLKLGVLCSPGISSPPPFPCQTPSRLPCYGNTRHFAHLLPRHVARLSQQMDPEGPLQ